MKKRLQIVFLISLTYFLIIIPAQSQTDKGVIASGNETIQVDIAISHSDLMNLGSESNGNIINNSGLQIISGEILQENSTNYIGQNIQIEEISSESIDGPQTIQNLSENNFETGSTGEIVQINQYPQIIISEIYYDGTEEWMEIANLGSYFSGEVELETPQSIFFPVSLQQDQSIILTKSSQSYTRISPLVIQQMLPLSFSFTDTKAIFITLWRSGQLIDTFQAETGLVVRYNDKKTSLTKEFINQDWIVTGSSSAINVTTPYLASPGFFDFSSNFETGDQNQTTGGSEDTQTTEQGSSSGSDFGGGGMTGCVDIPTPISPQSDILAITEIYQSNGLLSDFIELKAPQNFSGKIFLSGSLLKTGLELDLFLEEKERIIIVYFDNGWLSDQKKIENTGLELNNSGLLQIFGQSGQVFDTIQILSTSGNKSNYHGDFSNGDIDIFSKIDDFSPGFDEQLLVYFKVINNYTTGQISEISGFSDQTGSGGMSTEISQNGQLVSSITFSGITIEPKNLEITALSHFTPESITIKSNLAISIDLSQKDRYLLSKEKPTSQRKSIKKYLTGILNSGDFITISKTRGFLNAGSCIGLFYKTGQLDQRCYGSALPQTIQEQKPQLEEELEFIPNISIIGVLPNPIGKDDHEELHIFSTGLDFIIPSKTLYIKINSTKKYLTGTFSKDKEKIFIGSLGLVNKPACAELWYETKLLDTYCYPQPEEGEYLEKGKETQKNETGTLIQTIPNITIQGLLPNPKGKDDHEIISIFRTTGIIVSGNEVIHPNLLQLPHKSLYLLNNTKKTYFIGSLQPNTGTIFKGSLGLLNKAHCVELRYMDTQLDKFCYSNPKEDQYFGSGNDILQTVQKSDFSILQDVGFIVTGSQICVRYFDQMLTCRQLPASKTSIKLKNENKLYKTYVGLLQNYLIKDRSTLYFNTPIIDYFTTLKNSKAQVKNFSPTITISGQQFDIYDLSGQIDLTTSYQGLSGGNVQEKFSWRNRFILRLGL